MSDAGGSGVTRTVRERGDRAAFLARARARLAGGIPANPVHLPPSPTPMPPTVRFTALDPDDLPGTFVAMATAVDAEVHRVTGDEVAETVVALARRYGATCVVRTPEPSVTVAAEALAEAGLRVEPYVRAASAEVGLTGAVAGVAATGSVVLDSAAAGSRAAGLLPPVHVCVLAEAQLVATPAEVLHPLARGAPSSLVLVGGPSRTGDVEQILTLGVHGPRHVHVVLVASGA